jgi:parallel beta-helix repeat protein
MKNILITALIAAVLLTLTACPDPAGGSGTPVNPPASGISGNITSDQIWDSNTYVSGSVYVENGAVLTIGPGVTVSFASGAYLEIEAGGQLSAVGNSAEDGGILFKNAGTSGWGGIYFDDNAVDNIMRYCTVTGVSSDNYAVTLDFDAQADIEYCLIYGNGGGGIDAEYCGDGTILRNNRFYDNSLYPIVACDEVDFDATNSFAAVGDPDGPDLSDPYNRIHFCRGIAKNNYIFNITEVPYRFSDICVINNEASLTVFAGVTLQFDALSYLEVEAGGTLSVQGTSSSPVVFEGTNSAASWNGVHFGSDAVNNTLTYATISGVYTNYAIVFGSDSIASITHCTIGDNHAGGIDAEYAASGTVISDNTFGDNGDSSIEKYYDLVYNDSITQTGNSMSSYDNVND